MDPIPERQTSPLLSNNPFRNRAASPTNLPSPTIASYPPNMTSKNPFLDTSEQATTTTSSNGATSPTKPQLTGNTAELFENLGLDDKSQKPLPPLSSANGSMRRAENIPPRLGNGRMPPPGHRPSRSREEEERRRRAMRAKGQSGDQLDIFADPTDPKPRERRARRNSDSSTIDRHSKSLETEEEKRRRRRKEREMRHGAKGSKSKIPGHRLDVIDKLDVTSIYGTGLFHHDGPFDACNPHRNRQGMRTTPMSAFPKDSRNMALGGSGPINKDIDHAQFLGSGAEGYNDYSTSRAAGPESDVIERPKLDERSQSFNPTLKADPVHGPESMGLGTSTFLEGAPASRLAIQRRESEQEAQMAAMAAAGAGGLGRKKSLAQRIRGISNGRPGPGGRMMSPEPAYPLQRTMTPTSPPLATSASATNGSGKPTENNPFFKEYDNEYEKKGAKIAVAEESNGGRARAMSSPRKTSPPPGLQRTMTNDSIGGGEAAKTGGGFLNRVKSLKGGRRARPVRDIS